MRKSQSSQPLGHIEALLIEGHHVGNSGPSGEAGINADSKSSGLVEKFHSSEKEPIELPEVVTPSKQNALASRDMQTAEGVKNVPTEDESYEGGTSDASSLEIRKIATPKGKKIAVSRAKAAVQSYHTKITMRGKSALTDMASKTARRMKTEANNGHEQPALRREDVVKLNSAADQGRTLESTMMAEADEAGSQGASSSRKKVGLKTKLPSGLGQQSARGTGNKRSSGLAGDLSAPKAQGEGRSKAFRGNQYFYADGTPRPRKGHATHVQ